jgi:hypothetical protein
MNVLNFLKKLKWSDENIRNKKITVIIMLWVPYLPMPNLKWYYHFLAKAPYMFKPFLFVPGQI